jgi:hypothetical protein
MAANELFIGQPGHRAPYADEFGTNNPPAGAPGPEDPA